MSVYVVSYDLKASERNYLQLHEAIKSYEYFDSELKSLWFIDTDKSALEIRDHLKDFIGKNDAIFVAEIFKGHGGGSRMRGSAEWLNSESRTFPKSD